MSPPPEDGVGVWGGRERGGDLSCVGKGRIQSMLEMTTERLSRYLDGPLRDSKWARDAMLLCQKNYPG